MIETITYSWIGWRDGQGEAAPTLVITLPAVVCQRQLFHRAHDGGTAVLSCLVCRHEENVLPCAAFVRKQLTSDSHLKETSAQTESHRYII